MFLSAVLFVLFAAGCWLYCLADAALTPAAEFPGLRKPVWITVIAVTFILGAVAWVVARRSWRIRNWPPASAAYVVRTDHDTANIWWYPLHPPHHDTDPHTGPADSFLAAEALARHPASRSRNVPGGAVPIGPDDDPEFLRMLAERIRGEQ
jgi:hypothetical protein